MSLLAPHFVYLAGAFGMGRLMMSAMISPRMLLSVDGACILYCAGAAFHAGNHESTLLAICGTAPRVSAHSALSTYGTRRMLGSQPVSATRRVAAAATPAFLPSASNGRVAPSASRTACAICALVMRPK
jgi:hypothetical protein